jgi:hypothetical protein
MASIKMAYVGGGSSRAAGTMASLLAHGKEFDGSHVVLIDQRQDRLDLVERIATKLARAQGLDITVETTTDQRSGLTYVYAVQSSFRAGGFELIPSTDPYGAPEPRSSPGPSRVLPEQLGEIGTRRCLRVDRRSNGRTGTSSDVCRQMDPGIAAKSPRRYLARTGSMANRFDGFRRARRRGDDP